MSELREQRRERLVEVYREASVCTKCPLSETRTNVVFGSGDADANLMFVGEAPGAEEDRQGLPFVGRAGGLLTELLEGIGMTREEVWITNVLRCRPPGNRDPQPIEIESCHPYLERQVELIRPRVIATLGNFATKLITRGLSVAQIAEWLGTSSAMIERHYHKHLMERNAHLLNGVSLHLMIDPNPDPWRTPEDDRLDELVDR